MSKKLPYLLTCLFAALSFNAVTAQEYVQMPIASGLNADVIANGVGTAISSTSIDIDGVNYNYVATDFKLTATSTPITYGVPVNGLINSAVTSTPGLSYQLAPVTGNNSLRLPTAAPTGTVTFTTPTAAVTLYMLAVTGSGTGTVTVTVNYTDGTSTPFASTTVSDWYDGANAAIIGIGRINRTNNGLESSTTNPRMYQIALAIPPANQSKPIASVQVTKTSTGGEVVNVFAFSANAYTSCPAPTNITAVSTTDGATINWTAPATAPSGGYDYYTSASATPPTATTTPTGNVAAGTNTKTLTGYAIGSSYYFWIRSNCGGTTGFWKQVIFTPGQIVLTYTTGEISSQYNNAPTITSTTACPGNLTATIPPGFKIASVATSYNFTAQAGLFMSEQQSLLACTTNNTTEASLSTAPGNGGTAVYNRTGINIANGLEGTVAFQLRAWRVWGGADCNVTYGKIDNNTWKITINLEYATCATPATPTAANQNICPQATMGDLTVTGTTGAVNKFYTAPTGGTAITASTAVANGTFYVSQTVGTCESARSAAFTVTLAPTAAPTAAAQTHCGGTTVAALTTTSGVNTKWYAAETGGSALAATTALATGNYYVSQTVGGCESARIAVAVTVNTTPVPVAGTSQVFCAGSGATVANLQATAVTGATLKWYSSETSTTVLASTAVLGTGTYYVSQTIGTCEGLRASVSVAVATVVQPTVFAQELCAGATVANLVATGGQGATYKWFDSATSTTPLASTALVVGGTYYVSQTLGTCEGPKASVVVTINNITAPVVEGQDFCAGATVASLVATPSAGAAIRWYNGETSAVVLTSTTPLVSGTYYVSQKLNNCESGRTAVEVVVNAAVTAPTAASPQAVCITATLADLGVETTDGAALKWYASATTSATLAADAPAAEGTYYVSQTVGDCEGPRTAVAVTHLQIPVPTSASFAVCNGTLLSELEVEGVEGGTFNWYSSLDGDTSVSAATAVTAGSLYVSQTVDGCESGRVAVAFTVSTTAVPTPAATQAFCGEGLVSELDGGATTGYTANWYSPDGAPLTGTEPLVTGTYTVSQTSEGCESATVAVSVVVSQILGAPVGEASQEFNAGDTVSDLTIETEAGAQLQWYFYDEQEDAWFEISSNTNLTDGYTYGVTQAFGTCESERLPITVSVILGNPAFELKGVKVYPNPASDVVNVQANEVLSGVVIYNLLGQEVLRQSANADTVQLNISSLPQATYIMQASTANGGAATFKIVKQ